MNYSHIKILCLSGIFFGSCPMFTSSESSVPHLALQQAIIAHQAQASATSQTDSYRKRMSDFLSAKGLSAVDTSMKNVTTPKSQPTICAIKTPSPIVALWLNFCVEMYEKERRNFEERTHYCVLSPQQIKSGG